MYNSLYGEAFNLFNTFAKTAADATRQLAEINSRTYERLAKRQVELSSDLAESSIKNFVSHAVAAQREIAEEYASKAQAANKDAVKIITQAQNELNGYLENQLPAAMEQVKAVVQDVTQEAAENARSSSGRKAA
jgi:formate dehydrogenase maturation protein FdhE